MHVSPTADAVSLIFRVQSDDLDKFLRFTVDSSSRFVRLNDFLLHCGEMLVLRYGKNAAVKVGCESWRGQYQQVERIDTWIKETISIKAKAHQ